MARVCTRAQKRVNAPDVETMLPDLILSLKLKCIHVVRLYLRFISFVHVATSLPQPFALCTFNFLFRTFKLVRIHHGGKFKNNSRTKA